MKSLLTNVSRETTARLREYEAALRDWSRRINLISESTQAEIWTRHVEDSAQLWPLRPEGARHWIDLGSGAGLPGLVIAILAEELAPKMRVSLIEADSRKIAFIRHCSAILGVRCDIHHCRIENFQGLPGDVISARALASLERLLSLALPLTHEGTVMLFPKGRTGISELTSARRTWHIEGEGIASQTDPDAIIVKITRVGPR